MKLILDMNIPPKLVELLKQKQVCAGHWYLIGSPSAEDAEIMEYARNNNCIVVTCDLDFTSISTKRARVRLLPLS